MLHSAAILLQKNRLDFPALTNDCLNAQMITDAQFSTTGCEEARSIANFCPPY